MKNKSFVLLLASVAFILLFFLAPANNVWLTGRLWPYIASFPLEKDHMSLDDRKAYKYRESYMILMNAANYLSSHNAVDPVILLPPNSYIREQHVKLHVPEPVVFYYFTGYRAVWTDSPGVENADWALLIHDGKVHLAHLKGPEQLQELLALYKDYTPTL